MSNVTTLQTGKPSFSLAPKDLDEALRFADMLASSTIVPKDYLGKPGNCLVAIQWGMELGLQPMQAMQSIAVINGRPSLWGDAMLALVKAHQAFEWIKETSDANGATCTIKRRGEPEVVQTFTVEDAKRAGLYGKQGPWQQYPKRMMQMRARGFALRDAFPDALRGVVSAEEAHDAPAEKDMGAADVVPPEEKPASRTEGVKAKLLGKRPKEAPGVTLAQVLASISNMHDKAERDAAKAKAELLTDPEQIEEARAAYASRLDALKAEAAHQTDHIDETPHSADSAGVVDADTGEVLPPAADTGDWLAEFEREEKARGA